MSNQPLRSSAAAVVELRPAGSEDEDFLFEVFAAWRGLEFAYAGCSDSQVELLLRLQYRSKQREYAARFPASGPSIIIAGGRQAGVVHLARSEQEYHVVEIAILPEFRNKKIGTTILKEFIEEAKRHGTPVFVSVAKSNSGSIRFHKSLGFTICGDDGVYLQMEFRSNSALFPEAL